MFFEQSEIIDLLKCENCSQQYDEYFPPRILPCCGKTLCYTCIQSIEKQLKNNKFKCIACNKEDTIPNNGLKSTSHVRQDLQCNKSKWTKLNLKTNFLFLLLFI